MADVVEIIIRTIDETSGANGKVIGSFTELKSAIDLGKQALEYIDKAYEATIGKTIAYADEVRKLALVSGTTVEVASGMIEVADKTGVAVSSLETAMRFMSKNGVEPNIEGIAKLSDEYLKLAPGMERNNFLIKEFGRSGLDMAFMLSQGSDALIKLSGEVNKNMILTEKQVEDAHKAAVAQQEWKDTTDGLAISFSNKLLPALTDTTNGLSLYFSLAESTNGAVGRAAIQHNIVELAMKKQAETTKELSTETGIYSEAVRDASANNQQLSKTTQNLTSDTQTLISGMVSLQGADDKATKSFVFNMLEKKIAAAGFSDELAFDMEIKAGEALGIFDAKTAATMKGIDSLTSQVVDGTVTINQFGAAIDGLPTKKTIEISAVLSAQDLYNIYGDSAHLVGSGAHRATGGFAGGKVWVGEQGPELVDLPSGSYVHSNTDSMRMSSSGNTIINIPINNPIMIGSDERSVAQVIRPAVIQVARQQGWQVH